MFIKAENNKSNSTIMNRTAEALESHAYRQKELQQVLERMARPMSVMSDRFFEQPMVKVDGKILHLNSRLIPNLPFTREQIEEGFSLFVDWSGKGHGWNWLGLWEHGRSVSSNVSKFADRYGNIYKCMALKGSGMPKRSDKGNRYGRPVKRDDDSVFGLEEYWNARQDWENSNKFISKGIPTALPIAIIKPKNISLYGKKESIRELKTKISPGGTEPLIPKTAKYSDWTTNYKSEIFSFTPVFYLIGYYENLRIIDAKAEDYLKFAKEHGMSLTRYTHWGIGNFAERVAMLHNLKWRHSYLSDHNTTIDWRFVDSDGARPVTKHEEASGSAYLDDASSAITAISNFHEKIVTKVTVKEDTLKKEFVKKYIKNRKNVGEAKMKELRELARD